MVSQYEALSIELSEYTVKSLGVSDIASLPLKSRIMESKVSQGCFTIYFNHKNIEFTAQNLQKVVRLTSQSRLVRLLRHCTVTAILRTEMSSALDTAEHLRDLLPEVFNTLKQDSTQGGITSLCLRIAARTESADGELSEGNEFCNWRSVW